MTIKKSLLIWALMSLTVVMTAFYGVFLSKTKVENLLAHGDNLFWTLTQKIPAELEIRVKNGEVVINKERPYCLLLESKSRVGVYFSNSDSQVIPKEGECGALMTVGKDYVMIREENGSYRVYKVDPKADYTINKNNIESFYQNNKPKAEKVAWTIFYVGPWLGWLAVFGWGLLNCLWYAWVAKFALRIFQSNKTVVFNQVYGTVLFLMSGWWFLRYGILYIIVNNYFHQNIVLRFPFMNTLILTILALIWYKNYDKKEEVKK